MRMVRQWQQLLHGERYSHSYSASLPDFVKLAEAFGCVGLRAEDPAELDDKIREMIDVRRPVIFDCRVTKEENCFPMIPSGKAHNEMILAEDNRDLGTVIDDAGKRLAGGARTGSPRPADRLIPSGRDHVASRLQAQGAISPCPSSRVVSS